MQTANVYRGCTHGSEVAENLVELLPPAPLSAFFGGARRLALRALEPHDVGDHRRLPLDAGRVLEHLAYLLARAVPALLTELEGDPASAC